MEFRVYDSGLEKEFGRNSSRVLPGSTRDNPLIERVFVSRDALGPYASFSWLPDKLPGWVTEEDGKDQICVISDAGEILAPAFGHYFRSWSERAIIRYSVSADVTPLPSLGPTGWSMRLTSRGPWFYVGARDIYREIRSGTLKPTSLWVQAEPTQLAAASR